LRKGGGGPIREEWIGPIRGLGPMFPGSSSSSPLWSSPARYGSQADMRSAEQIRPSRARLVIGPAGALFAPSFLGADRCDPAHDSGLRWTRRNHAQELAPVCPFRDWRSPSPCDRPLLAHSDLLTGRGRSACGRGAGNRYGNSWTTRRTSLSPSQRWLSTSLLWSSFAR
jgi:hypothetical protein